MSLFLYFTCFSVLTMSLFLSLYSPCFFSVFPMSLSLSSVCVFLSPSSLCFSLCILHPSLSISLSYIYLFLCVCVSLSLSLCIVCLSLSIYLSIYIYIYIRCPALSPSMYSPFIKTPWNLEFNSFTLIVIACSSFVHFNFGFSFERI